MNLAPFLSSFFFLTYFWAQQLSDRLPSSTPASHFDTWNSACHYYFSLELGHCVKFRQILPKLNLILINWTKFCLNKANFLKLEQKPFLRTRMHSSRMRTARSTWGVCLSVYWNTPPGCGPGDPRCWHGDPPGVGMETPIVTLETPPLSAWRPPMCRPGDPTRCGPGHPPGVGLDTPPGQTPQPSPGCEPGDPCPCQTPQAPPWVSAGRPARHAGIPPLWRPARHAGIPPARHAGIPPPPSMNRQTRVKT